MPPKTTTTTERKIHKIQCQTPVATPQDVYTFIDSKRSRATFTAQVAGVDVFISPAPNRQPTQYQHFLVPWNNLVAVFYEAVPVVVEKEAPAQDAVEEAAVATL
jgi:hypothetical protein